MTRRTNEQWTRAIAGGEESANGELRTYLHRGLAKALAGRNVREPDLEDFTQEAMMRISDRLDSFRGDARFTTWAMAVAVRVALTRLRRRRYLETPEVDLAAAGIEGAIESFSGGAGTEANASRRRLGESLHAAIRDDLTEKQRAAVLGELQGIPSEELAVRLGIARNALYKLHHDARKKLRAALETAGYGAADVRSVLDASSEEA